jgi:hypothetical protein
VTASREPAASGMLRPAGQPGGPVLISDVDADAIIALDDRLSTWRAGNTPADQLINITIDELRPVAAALRAARRTTQARAR